jgi:exopolysaccharide biosynthesis polyprenyl glycosylphosphotransferase
MIDKSPSMQRLFIRLRPNERLFILMVGDVFATVIALAVALYFWSQRDWLQFSWEFLKQRPASWFYILPLIWILLISELYDDRRASRRSDTVQGIGIAALISLVLYLGIFFIAEPNSLPRRGVAAFIVCSSLLTLAWRMLYIRLFTTPQFLRRILIIGAGRAGAKLTQIVKEIWPPPFYLVGLVDDDPQKLNSQIEGFPVMGDSSHLIELIQREHVTDLILAITVKMKDEMFRSVLQAEENGIEVTTMPKVYEDLLGRVPIFLLQSDWILRSFIDQAHTGGFYEVSKRLIDLFGGLVGTIITICLLPFIGLGILLDSGAPIFYSQIRLGRNGLEYPIYKFRTMRQDAESDGKARQAVAHDDRVTFFGRFLRKTHLDELPQFINILRGDMSLVGPRAERPELVDVLQQEIPFYRARLFVKPGLTGWAQVNQNYASNPAENGIKLEYDLYYIKHRNLLLDLVILVRTAGAVFGLRGQ